MIVTNQQGIGLGYFSTQDFIAVNQKMLQLLGPEGIRISRIYYCPHSMAEECACRKPRGGMLQRAMADADVSAERAFLLGDTIVDFDAAKGVGCAAFPAGEGQFLSAVQQVLKRLGN